MGRQRTSLRAAPRVFPEHRRLRAVGLRCARVATVLAAVLAATAAQAEKTDVIILANGDHLTGEIKGMSRGRLDFNTDDAGRPSIEWSKVARVTSTHAFEVELASGIKYYGTLQSPEDFRVLVGSDKADTFPVTDIVTITPMDALFWSRVKASFDLGFTLTKASSSMTLSGDGTFAYRGQHFGGALDFNGYWQRFSDSTHVGQFSATLTGTYYFLPNWLAQLQLIFNHNDELQLDARIGVGGGVAYALVRSNWTEFWISWGLLASYEQYTNVEPNENIAAYVGGDWEAYIYDSPKLSAGTTVEILPILNELWRTRGSLTFKIKYEVFKDFFVGTNFTFNFDTEPPDVTAAHTDYLLSLTIGWSYRQ